MADDEGKLQRPRADAVFFPIAGGAVVFDKAIRKLFALNPAAGLAWLCLGEGASLNEIARAMAESFGTPIAVTQTWAKEVVGTFRDLDLLGDVRTTEAATDAAADPPAARDAAPRSRKRAPHLYEVLGIIIEVDTPPTLHARVESLLGQLAIDGVGRDPSVRAAIEPVSDDLWRIDVDGCRSEPCSSRQLVPELERLLVQRVVPATPHLLALHCAGLRRSDGRAFLFAAASGTGKTTLSAVLARAGWRFSSDELVLVTEDGSLRGLPIPACIKAESFDRIGNWFPCLTDTPSHDRYGQDVRYLALPPGPLGTSAPCVVMLRREPLGQTNVRPLSSFEGLQRLLAQCLFVPPTFEASHVERLLAWHRSVAYFELVYADCLSAVDVLTSANLARLRAPPGEVLPLPPSVDTC